MKLNFKPPVIIGALCARKSEIPPALVKAFAKLKPRFAFLPFCVEKRHLKNTIECMKLTDVAGLLVCGSHRRDIVPFIKNMDKSAKEAGTVDIVVRKGNNFVGVSIEAKKGGVGIFCQTCVEILTSCSTTHN